MICVRCLHDCEWDILCIYMIENVRVSVFTWLRVRRPVSLHDLDEKVCEFAWLRKRKYVCMSVDIYVILKRVCEYVDG